MITVLFLSCTSHMRGMFAANVPGNIAPTVVVNDGGCMICHTTDREAPYKLPHASLPNA